MADSSTVSHICRGNSFKIVWAIKMVDYNGVEIESGIPSNVVVNLLTPTNHLTSLSTVQAYEKLLIISFDTEDTKWIGKYSLECKFTVDGVKCRITKENAFYIVENSEESNVVQVDGMRFITTNCQIGTTENLISFTVLDVNEESGDTAEELYTKISSGTLFKATMDSHTYMADIATTDTGYMISFYTGTYHWDINIKKDGDTYTKTYSFVKYDY